MCAYGYIVPTTQTQMLVRNDAFWAIVSPDRLCRVFPIGENFGNFGVPSSPTIHRRKTSLAKSTTLALTTTRTNWKNHARLVTRRYISGIFYGKQSKKYKNCGTWRHPSSKTVRRTVVQTNSPRSELLSHYKSRCRLQRGVTVLLSNASIAWALSRSK